MGYSLNAYFGIPNLEAHAAFTILLLTAAVLTIAGAIRLWRGSHAKTHQILCLASIILMVFFSVFDPLLEMNGSPSDFVISILCFALGCVLCGETFHRGYAIIGTGTMLFWLSVSWVVWGNYELIRILGGKWGVGLFGAWKS